MNELISIIIPVYNQADKIGDCLDSILKQTYQHIEVIVVNDGSSDRIDEIIESYKTKFSNGNLFYFSKENEGSNPTRNFGYSKAAGEYLLFCDADITLKSDMLEKMMVALQTHQEVSFVFSAFYYGPKLFRLFPYDENRLRAMPYIHTTSLIRREHFPGFDNSIRRLQDWDLWLTMLRNHHRGFWLEEPLFKVKTSGHISTWLPRFTYKLFPFLPSVQKYKESVRYIKHKHDIA